MTEKFGSNVWFKFYKSNSIFTSSFLFIPVFWAFMDPGLSLCSPFISASAGVVFANWGGGLGLGAAGLFHRGI